jgi:serine/threonine protein kinase
LTSHRPLLRETSFNGGTGVQTMAALTATMTKGVGTLLWMAPELFQGGSKYGPEVDVYVALCGPSCCVDYDSGGRGHVSTDRGCLSSRRYSYGVILWELATRERPWDQIKEQQYIKFYAALSAALEADERPTLPPAVVESQPDFVALLQQCWRTEPTSRPPFGEVVCVLTR